MANFNLEDYEPVEARLKKYLKAYPDARIITKVEHQEENRIVIKAIIYQNRQDQLEKVPHSTGIAEETRGEGYVNKTSHVENCETSAVGRALANAGFSGNKNGQRASREEMKKVQRIEQESCQHENTSKHQVTKEGKNKGRWFIGCNDCKAFIEWTEEPKELTEEEKRIDEAIESWKA